MFGAKYKEYPCCLYFKLVQKDKNKYLPLKKDISYQKTSLDIIL